MQATTSGHNGNNTKRSKLFTSQSDSCILANTIITLNAGEYISFQSKTGVHGKTNAILFK